jgi:hypothetical protein
VSGQPSRGRVGPAIQHIVTVAEEQFPLSLSAILSVAVLVAGCGGRLQPPSDDPTDASRPTPSEGGAGQEVQGKAKQVPQAAEGAEGQTPARRLPRIPPSLHWSREANIWDAFTAYGACRTTISTWRSV